MWWKYLNPLNWLNWLSTIKQILDLLGQGISYIKKAITKKKQEKQIEELQRAVDHAKEAKTIEESAKAACEIEKSFNPDSNCDANTGKQ